MNAVSKIAQGPAHAEWLRQRDLIFSLSNGADVDQATSDACDAGMVRLEGLILGTPAASLAGVIAKAMLSLRLIAEGSSIVSADAAAILEEASAHGLLSSDAPTAAIGDTFTALRAELEQALAAERAYDRTLGGRTPTRAEWAESERLTNVRDDVENRLMALSSGEAGEFAYKYLVAHGDGRDTDQWDAMLEAEARRFASPDPGNTELETMLKCFDEVDAWAESLNKGSPTDTEIDAWSNECGRLTRLAIALPLSAECMAVKARAVGSACENTADLANLSLPELSDHAEGDAGELIRQILAFVMKGPAA